MSSARCILCTPSEREPMTTSTQLICSRPSEFFKLSGTNGS